MIENTLAGKDYFTEAEAAHYACVSVGHFRKRSHEYGITYGVFMGKKFYRRADLAKLLEESWHRLHDPRMDLHGS